MAKNNNLTDFLTDVANTIRAKKGTTGKINPQNFSSEIESIQTGTETSDATAVAADILLGKTAYAKGAKLTGTIPTYDGTVTQGGKPFGIGYNVSFMADGEEYYFVSCEQGSSISAPPTPKISGKIFTSWLAPDGSIVNFPYTPTENITLTGAFSTGWILGVTGLQNSTPALTRTDDNVGKTWSYDSSTGAIEIGEFNTIFPEEYVGDDLQEITYSPTASRWEAGGVAYSGNVFRKINKFYKQVIVSGSTRQGFKIAVGFSSAPSGYYCPAYFRDANNNELDFMLIGVYKAQALNSKLYSKTGVTPTYNTSSTAFQTYGKASGNSKFQGFCKDWRANQLLTDLFMIIFATRNSETVFLTSWRSYGSLTGASDSMHGISQCGLVGGTCCYFLGIEDFIGNGFESISGVYFSNSTIYISYDPAIDTTSTSSKSSVGYSRSTTSGFITRMGYTSSHPDFEYPVAVGDSSSTYYCDYCYYNASGQVVWQGAHGFSSNNGVFFLYGYNSASYSYSNNGARLCGQPI